MAKPLSADYVNTVAAVWILRPSLKPRPDQTGPESAPEVQRKPAFRTPWKSGHLRYCRHFVWSRMHLFMFVYNQNSWNEETSVFREADRFPSPDSTWTVKSGLRGSLKLFWERGCHIPVHLRLSYGMSRKCWPGNTYQVNDVRWMQGGHGGRGHAFK